MSEITRLLERVEQGDSQAGEELLPVVYEELRRLAAHRLAQESSGQTLQPTALVHEAWLRLSGDRQPPWENRAHFFGAAAEAMRRILIDRARSKQAARHGGGWQRVEPAEIDDPAQATDTLLLHVHEALDKLAQEDPRAAEFVKLRFFVGLSVEEAALSLGVTDRTARRDWRFARAWLREEFERQGA